MKPTVAEFVAQKRKSITLIGMSGVGKSHLSTKLADWGWCNYCCDDLIGSDYLKMDNMADLAAFVGQIGDPAKGGVGLEEFRRRQNLYYEAECDVVRDLGKAIAEAEGHFVCDSSGSLCEVRDEDILEQAGAQTLFVYLEVDQEDHAEILERAVKYPKPLFFPPAFFDERLEMFMEKFDVGAVENIDPKAFLSWVFPYLFESRLPKYQKLADQYGVTVSANKITNVNSEDEFFEIVMQALDD